MCLEVVLSILAYFNTLIRKRNHGYPEDGLKHMEGLEMNKEKEAKRIGFNYGFYTALVSSSLLFLVILPDVDSNALRTALFVIWFLLAFIINISARVLLYTKEV